MISYEQSSWTMFHIYVYLFIPVDNGVSLIPPFCFVTRDIGILNSETVIWYKSSFRIIKALYMEPRVIWIWFIKL